MKNSFRRILTVVAIGMIALCVSPKPAAAQDAMKGTFTLADDVRWSGALLPAGEYTFSLQSRALPARILIHGPNGYALVLASATAGPIKDRASSLTIERSGGTRFVRDIYLAEIGVELRYAAPKLPHNEIAQGPRNTEQVLVAMTTK
jgi:hypothetical protein